MSNLFSAFLRYSRYKHAHTIHVYNKRTNHRHWRGQKKIITGEQYNSKEIVDRNSSEIVNPRCVIKIVPRPI